MKAFPLSHTVSVGISHAEVEGGQTEIAQLIFLLVKSRSHHHLSSHTRASRSSGPSRFTSLLLRFPCRTLLRSTDGTLEMKGFHQKALKRASRLLTRKQYKSSEYGQTQKPKDALIH